MTTPEDAISLDSSSSGSYSVIKSCEIDGLKIEFIQKENLQKSSSIPKEAPVAAVETISDDTDDPDDSSTVCLEDIEVIKQEMNNFIEDQQSFYPDPVEKLAPIVEEAEKSDDLDGAAGLWAKNYQLPCFNTSNTYKNVNIGIGYSEHPSRSRDFLQNSQNQNQFSGSSFDELMKATNESLILTKNLADCGFCKREIDVGRGVVLKECLHTFCRRCLVFAIENSPNAVMMCPSRVVNCQSEVRDDEIKALLTPEGYENYVHQQLVRMDVLDLAELHESYDFVENKNNFHCEICTKDTKAGDGIVLKDCLHQYCKPCLGRYIETSDEVEVSCPFRAEDGSKCIGIIMDTEMRSLIPLETYVDFLKKSLATAEAANPNAFHCKTPDCPAWIEIIGEIAAFECPACKRQNCVACKAVHQGVTCEDYQDMLHGPERRARELRATEEQVRGLIASKNAQNCPRCGILTQRIDGCRHMTCTKCRHEFQWEGN